MLDGWVVFCEAKKVIEKKEIFQLIVNLESS